MSNSNGKPKPRKRRKDARVANAADGVNVSNRTVRRKMKRCDHLVDLAAIFAEVKHHSEVRAESLVELFLELTENVSDADLAVIAKLPPQHQFVVAERLWKADKPTGAELFAEIRRPKPAKGEQLIAEICRFLSDSSPDDWDEFRGKLLARGLVIGTDDSQQVREHCGDDAEWSAKVVEVVEAMKRTGKAIVDLPVARFDAYKSPHGEHNTIFRPIAENAVEPDETETDDTETDIAANCPRSDEPNDDEIAGWVAENESAPASDYELVGAEPALSHAGT